MDPKKKTFEEMFNAFLNDLTREYGLKDTITKIALSPELHHHFMVEKYENCRTIPNNTACGIEVVARRPETF